jgi:hypothetical protein
MGLRVVCVWLLIALLLAGVPGEAAIRFTNNADLLSRTTGLPPYGNLTRMCWVYLITENTNGSISLVNGDSASTGHYLDLTTDGARTLLLQANLGSGDLSNTTTTVLSLTTWYHMAYVFNASTTAFQGYANGQLLSNPFASIASNSTPWAYESLGGWSTQSGFTFFNLNGRMGGCKTWTAVLSQAEIQAEMLYITPLRLAGLQSYSPLRTATELTSYAGGSTWTTTGAPTTEADPPYPGGVSAGNGFLAW